MRLDEAGIIRLRELLIRYYPQMLKLCPSVDEVWFWDLLALAPLPESVTKLKRAKIEQLLKSHRIRRLDADQVLAGLPRAAADQPRARRKRPANMC